MLARCDEMIYYLLETCVRCTSIPAKIKILQNNTKVLHSFWHLQDIVRPK